MIQPLENVRLRQKTSFRIGGFARYFYSVSRVSDVQDLLLWAKQQALPVAFLGKGSNVLVSDAGFNGLVIETSTRFNGIRWEGTQVTAQSGALLQTIVSQAVERGMQGIECLAGIPGTLGGALIMNAGAFGREMGDIVGSVDAVFPDSSEVRQVPAGESGFRYRGSVFKDVKAFVLGGRLKLAESNDAEKLRLTYTSILQKRRAKQPLEKPNCGSVFKRPEGGYAGTLIEKCGLKGHRIGDAMVSLKHANFIVNLGNAKAADIRTLIARVQSVVHDKTGTLLEPEVIFLGEFDTPLLTA